MERKNKLNFHYIFWYFVIFSIVGLIVETLFGYITMGIIESRKGLIWGPFCPIYGVGAVILIAFLDRFKDNDAKVVLYGAILGCIVEYILSFILEAMYGSRFWDYGYKPFNLNGRICLTYALYWGVLSIVLMKYIKPKIDKIIKKIKLKIIDYIVLAFLIIDCIFTIWGITVYQNRVINDYYNQNNFKSSKIEEFLFSNEYMLKTFPNLRTRDSNGNEVFVRDLLKK